MSRETSAVHNLKAAQLESSWFVTKHTQLIVFKCKTRQTKRRKGKFIKITLQDNLLCHQN